MADHQPSTESSLEIRAMLMRYLQDGPDLARFLGAPYG
jgi:hypothetical protein